LFDKRDDFPFAIVRMPFILSNMPSIIVYSSIGAEILRISRASNNADQFISASKNLLNRMISQGAKQHKIVRVLKKTYGRHSIDFFLIASNATAFIVNLFN